MMPKHYEKPGTENLRAQQKLKVGKAVEQPSTSGKDLGGKANLRGQSKIKDGPSWKTPSGDEGHRVTHFKDRSV